jgi:hypothetical protein
MARRVIGWISGAFHGPATEAAVHFHQGPESTPAVCYDQRCPLPRLDPETAG